MEQPEKENTQGSIPFEWSLVQSDDDVQADLTEQQRERLTSHLAIRGVPLRNYTFHRIRSAFLGLFCAPRSSFENPSFRPSNQQRTVLPNTTENWKVGQATGRPKKRLYRKVLFRNLKTSSGFMMKPPDISRAAFVCRKDQEHLRKKEFVSVPYTRCSTTAKGQAKGKLKRTQGQDRGTFFPVHWATGKGQQKTKAKSKKGKMEGLYRRRGKPCRDRCQRQPMVGTCRHSQYETWQVGSSPWDWHAEADWDAAEAHLHCPR